ncbi:MAG: TIGR03089 family protein [Micromonosporaceae bacterium]|nr:TIGR03089 family protein [Micromonosporaceae bacterium]
MSTDLPQTPAGLLAAAVTEDPARPLITYYDDATGERTELSVATVDNWVAKTANLLVDGCGLVPGDRAVALLPAHWQTAAVLLGCWAAGMATSHGAPANSPQAVDVVFATAGRIDEARAWPAADRYALALAPLAAPLREIPDGFSDYVVDARQHGDRFVPYEPVDPDSDALVGLPRGSLSHQALASAGAERGAVLGLESGSRLLVVDGPDTPARPLDWLLAPLAAGASVVLCRNADPDKLKARAEQERITVTLS